MRKAQGMQSTFAKNMPLPLLAEIWGRLTYFSLSPYD